MKQELKLVEVKSSKELRDWLKRNHAQAESVWLVTYKKIVPEFYIEYSAIVDELLCYGWIDSLPRKLDARRKMLRISPRKSKSVWSKINREKVAKLSAEGRIKNSGLRVIERAKSDGSWSVLAVVDSGVLPEDLLTALKRFPKAQENFLAFPASTRQGILQWIAQAKTTTTRLKRLEITASLAAKNIRANQYQGAAKKKI